MDQAARIVDAVRAARQEDRRLAVCGHGSKRHWLPRPSGELLVMDEHSGVIAYDPAELVVTARAGTPIREVLAELASHGQTFAFDPPLYLGRGTIGGMVSTGLSGPARPWRGAVRDAVLGVEIVNGLGERLTFGGQVMKNVAGYDVSRLMTGAFGALGAVVQASIRVQPASEHDLTLMFELDADAANMKCRELSGRFLPLAGTWWHAGRLFVRLAGTEAGVGQAAAELGGERLLDGPMWVGVRDHTDEFFKPDGPHAAARDGQRLWRVIVPPAAVMPDVDRSQIAVEWAGGQRWWWHDDESAVQAYARRHGGWAWALGEQQTLPADQRKYMQAIKSAFDPDGIFVSGVDLGQAEAHAH